MTGTNPQSTAWRTRAKSLAALLAAEPEIAPHLWRPLQDVAGDWQCATNGALPAWPACRADAMAEFLNGLAR